MSRAEKSPKLPPRWRELDDGPEGYAKMRSTETAVVVLSPRLPLVP